MSYHKCQVFQEQLQPGTCTQKMLHCHNSDGSSTSPPSELSVLFLFLHLFTFFNSFIFLDIIRQKVICSLGLLIFSLPFSVFISSQFSKYSCDSISLVLQCLHPMLLLYSDVLFAFTLTVILLLYLNHTRASSFLLDDFLFFYPLPI